MQTTTLETARLMKEAGFNHNTEYAWVQFSNEKDNEFYLITEKELTKNENKQYPRKISNIYSAHTTDELLEILPRCVEHTPYGNKRAFNYWLIIEREYSGYCVWYSCHGKYFIQFRNEILAEALAAMCLYLRKEGLI